MLQKRRGYGSWLGTGIDELTDVPILFNCRKKEEYRSDSYLVGDSVYILIVAPEADETTGDYGGHGCYCVGHVHDNEDNEDRRQCSLGFVAYDDAAGYEVLTEDSLDYVHSDMTFEECFGLPISVGSTWGELDSFTISLTEETLLSGVYRNVGMIGFSAVVYPSSQPTYGFINGRHQIVSRSFSGPTASVAGSWGHTKFSDDTLRAANFMTKAAGYWFCACYMDWYYDYYWGMGFNDIVLGIYRFQYSDTNVLLSFDYFQLQWSLGHSFNSDCTINHLAMAIDVSGQVHINVSSGDWPAWITGYATNVRPYADHWNRTVSTYSNSPTAGNVCFFHMYDWQKQEHLWYEKGTHQDGDGTDWLVVGGDSHNERTTCIGSSKLGVPKHYRQYCVDGLMTESKRSYNHEPPLLAGGLLDTGLSSTQIRQTHDGDVRWLLGATYEF